MQIIQWSKETGQHTVLQTQKTTDWATRTPQNIGVELSCHSFTSGSCYSYYKPDDKSWM